MLKVATGAAYWIIAPHRRRFPMRNVIGIATHCILANISIKVPSALIAQEVANA
jgi:hypothetical protein